MTDKTVFSETLKKLMSKHPKTGKRTTQAQLGKYLGITVQAVSLYCTGKTFPDVAQIMRIANFFGVTIDYLLTGLKTENNQERGLLGLSDKAIDNLKKLSNDGEIWPLISSYVNAILSDPGFFSMLLEATRDINSISTKIIENQSQIAIDKKYATRLKQELLGGWLIAHESFWNFLRNIIQNTTSAKEAYKILLDADKSILITLP